MQVDAEHYSDRFFDATEQTSHRSAQEVVPIVRTLVPFRSVVDVGCGRGAWLHVFGEHGAERIVGYDGEYVGVERLLIPRTCFRVADLSKPFQIDGRFDLAVCLEVGEHLPARRARGLVEALCKAAPAVLFSAAIPGQGGTYHINEQWPIYWELFFNACGYIKRDCIRPRIWNDQRIAWWYRRNMFLFIDNAVSDKYPATNGDVSDALGREFEIVPPFILSRYMSVSGLLRELPRAIGRAIKRRLA
jgi:hypothetical protein